MASLQAHGLSDLGPEAQDLLAQVFKRREAAAASGTSVAVERVSKRGRTESGSFSGKVPVFLAEPPTRVDEDPNPFVVKWGLRNKDIAVGDSQATAEWSKNVVTPRDWAHIVDSSKDLQIELMGSQAIATANAYHQASLRNLRTSRAKKAIAERDRDRYFSASEANFERFRVAERELVDEKERVRQLEARCKA
ncbi:hypothetical protein POM88_007134 [Heracleum sosnowskyi]|uniref:Uncharacterized protein n=1 Tax=Heracleum sosnowskyi TaxID=360622 RepID=A0AAD8J6U6_9APIA|nr:hypothetical protein POM88_007134 [Heracleum sosnowskyi]